MKKGLFLTVLLAGVSALGFSQTVFSVSNVAAWIEAVNGIREGGNDKEYAINVTGTVSVPATPNGENTFGAVTGIKVTIAGSGTLSPSNIGNLLVIGAEQTAVAKDLTLKGRDNNNKSVVFIQNQGTFRMEGKASVTGNTNSSFGGVYINGGTFIMQDNASVSGNISTNDGGGIFINGGTFTMQGGTVSDNTAGWGGGVFLNKGTFTMQGGSVSSNTATSNENNGGGGGVFVGMNTFTMEGGTISGNIASSRYGGGVYISAEGTFTMQGSASLSGNKSGREGGGVYNRGTFAMKDNASVSGNTSVSSGGGVHNEGTFTMQDSVRVSGNTSNWGGGVLVSRGTFVMQDSISVSGNTASLGGGGVYVHEGTFTIQGAASISGNTSYRGGGVYIGPNGTFNKTGGTISGDDAEQNLKNTAIGGQGFAVYEGKNRSWRNASVGPTTNPGSYGFWLNEEAAATGFPPGFIGVWKRYNFNNTLSFTATTAKSSSRDVTWKFISVTGDTYTLEANTAAKTRLTLTIKYTESEWRGGDDYLKISGDSGNGENNWNGDWRKIES